GRRDADLDRAGRQLALVRQGPPGAAPVTTGPLASGPAAGRPAPGPGHGGVHDQGLLGARLAPGPWAAGPAERPGPVPGGPGVVEQDDLAADLGAVGAKADLGPAGAKGTAVGGGDPLQVDGADGQV